MTNAITARIRVALICPAVLSVLLISGLVKTSLGQGTPSFMGPYNIDTGQVLVTAQGIPHCDSATSGCRDQELGGTESNSLDFAWGQKVGMLTFSYNGAPSTNCTAIQIATDAVMTAAHCLHLKDANGVELPIVQATYTNKYQGFAADMRFADPVEVEPHAFQWTSPIDLTAVPQETGYRERDLDVALLKFKTPRPAVSNVYLFQKTTSDDVRFVDMFHHRSGRPKVLTHCNAQRVENNPTMLITDCVTDLGSSGAPLFVNDNSGSFPIKVLVALHAGSRPGPRVTSIAHSMNEIVRQASPGDGVTGILQLAGIAALVDYSKSETGNMQSPSLEQLSRKIRQNRLNTLLSNLRSPSTASPEDFAAARSLGVPLDRKALDVELRKVNTAIKSDDDAQDATLPQFMPSSGAVIDPPSSTSTPAKVSRFVLRNFDMKPSDTLHWVSSDLRAWHGTRTQAWQEKQTAGYAGGNLAPVGDAFVWMKIEPLPNGVWQRTFWRRELVRQRGAPSEFCADESGTDFVPAGAAFFVWFERYKFEKRVSRSTNSPSACLVRTNAERLTHPLGLDAQGSGIETNRAEVRITHLADLPTSEIDGMLPARLPSTVPDTTPGSDERPAPSQSPGYSHYRFVRFMNSFSKEASLPIRRTFEILTVKRLPPDPADPGIYRLRLVTCEIHPKANTWPIKWPDPADVVAEDCGGSSMTNKVLPHIVEQQYLNGTGVICEKDTVRDPSNRNAAGAEFVTVTRRWLDGVAKNNCLSD